MIKILRYALFDLTRSRWTIFYTAFYLLFTLALFWLSNDISKVIISLLNVILVLIPLIAMMFSIMYYYNSREFIELLLAQPIPRAQIFLGLYLGLALALTLCLIIGVGIPFLIYGLVGSVEIFNYLTLLGVGIFLSFIFSAIAFIIALRFENKIKGFGFAILTWLFFAIIYDGLFLVLLAYFNDYPIEKLALIGTFLNPIDLSRILVLLKLDISALMGFTGAIFEKFLGSGSGIMVAIGSLLLWIIVPFIFIKRISIVKDY